MSQVIRLAHALGYVEYAICSAKHHLTHVLAEYLSDHGEMSDQIRDIIKSHLDELENLESYISTMVDLIAGDK